MKSIRSILPIIAVLFLADFQYDQATENPSRNNLTLPETSSAKTSVSPLRFEHLTVDDGLPQNEIVAIYQDRTGYLWFGTKGGLTRYDGYEFTSYHSEPWTDTALSNNSITKIVQLREGTLDGADPRFQDLWVGTDGGGLNAFDRAEGTFVHFRHRPADSVSLSDENIGDLLQDRRGDFWVSTRHGLYRFNFHTGEFIPVDHDIPELPPLSLEEIDALCEDRSGAIWIGSNGGLYRHDPLKHTFVHFSSTAGRASERISGDSIRTIYESRDGTLWIGTTRGLDSFDPSTQAFTHLSLNRGISEKPGFTDIVSILEDSRGGLWIGTKGGGLGMLDRRIGTWTWSRNIPTEPSSISDDEVLSLAEDFTGTIWVGTRKGVNKLNPDKIKFNHFRSVGARGSNIVWSVCEASFRNQPALFVGTQAGLAIVDSATGRLSHFAPGIKGLDTLNQYPIRAMVREDSNVIWIGTIGGGLFRFDCETEGMSRYLADSLNPAIYSLAVDTGGVLWIGTNGPGLLRFHTTTGKYDDTFLKYGNDRSMDEWVITIHKPNRSAAHGDNILWLGTWEYGLERVDVHTGRRTYYRHTEEDPHSLGGNTVFSIHESESEPGVLWLGTSGGGLSRLDPHNGNFTTFDQRHGLSNNVIYGILEDRSGALWLSTNSGLFRFDPRTGQFRNYKREDGLQSNEFNLGSYFKSNRGDLFFGGPGGLNRFEPDRIINSHPPRLLLTHVTYPGGGTRSSWGEKAPGHIELSYDKGFISFGFSALHYKDPLKNRYAYMLSGAESEWHAGNGRAEATYTALPPGEYAFTLKAANCDGVWSAPMTMVSVVVTPPLWGRWWFYGMIFTFLASVVFFVHRSRVRNAVHVERATAAERERSRKKIAADFHDEIGPKVTAISLSKRLLEHDLGAIPENAQVHLSKIGSQVDQISREVRDLTWELDPDKESLLDLAEHLKGISDQLFDSTDVAFRLQGLSPGFATLRLPVEWRRHLTRIFKEAMHNAAKHATGCRNVILSFVIRNQAIVISLTDDGPGFDTSVLSSGSGLSNMNHRATLLNGTLSLVSSPLKGTTVRFEARLP